MSDSVAIAVTKLGVKPTSQTLPDEKLFVGVRYNKAEGQLLGISGDVGAKRWQLGGGWFITPGLLAKVEYVDQKYVGYPDNNKLNGGRFKGLIAEGVVAF